MPQTRKHISLCRKVGIPYIVVFLNRFETDDDMESLNTVETEVRELLTTCGFPGDDTPFIKGSARMALEGLDDDGLGTSAVKKLIETMDSYMPEPVRLIEESCLFVIESVDTSAEGGTVVTGEVERGTIKVLDEVEIVGLHPTATARCTQVQTSQRPCDEGKAGDKCSVMVSGVTLSDVCIPHTG